MQRYQGKVILITASATGIGLGIAERMAKEGGIVLINSRKESNVNAAVEKINSQGGKAYAFVGNMTDKKAREQIVQRIEKEFGRLDVLVLNHATSLHFGSTLDTQESMMDKMYETNFKSFILLIKETYHLLQKAKGNILINASYAGYTPDQTIGVYSILKTSLIGAVKLFSKEFQFDGIRVNGVAPGLIKTKLSATFWKDKANEELAKTNLKIDRLGEPDDIAGVAAFLCSDDAKYVTGETIIVMGTASPRL